MTLLYQQVQAIRSSDKVNEMILLSGHDVSILSLLYSLGKMPSLTWWPTYATAVVLEIGERENTSGEMYMRLRIDNGTILEDDNDMMSQEEEAWMDVDVFFQKARTYGLLQNNEYI